MHKTSKKFEVIGSHNNLTRIRENLQKTRKRINLSHTRPNIPNNLSCNIRNFMKIYSFKIHHKQHLLSLYKTF